MNNNLVSIWIQAFRLRTLPLAFSCIITAAFLAAYHFSFKWQIFVLSLSTTLFLQILSNLANDYGDTQNGADSIDRKGPARAVQAGLIDKEDMQTAMFFFTLLSFLSGMLLLYVSLKNQLPVFLLFLALGIAAIAAAIKYTAGKNPYGYKGFGDFFVFLFFGIVGVEGSFYLHTHSFLISGLLPATTVGLLSVAVLNLNNLRDHESDAKAGKRTLVVRIGFENAKKYHAALIIIATLCAISFSVIDLQSFWQFLYLPVFLFLFFHLKKVTQSKNPLLLDVELKKVALATFFFSILFGLGLIL